MMGPRQQANPKLFYTEFNLDARVDPAHRLRKIAAVCDFTQVRQAVASLYGTRGNPSLDPTLLLKLLFLLFYENVSSERELLRQLPSRLDWLWFLEMDLDSDIPDHSVLSKARRRWGPQVFAGFFQQVLASCVQAGLVDGSRVHVDGSLIAADADMDKIKTALTFVGESFYEQLEAQAAEQAATGKALPLNEAMPAAAATITNEAPVANEASTVSEASVTNEAPATSAVPAPANSPAVIAVGPEPAPAAEVAAAPPSITAPESSITAPESPSAEAASPSTSALSSAASPSPFVTSLSTAETSSAATLPAAPQTLPPGTRYCPTDPEARLTRKYSLTVLGYKDHRVVDDRFGIITATLTTPAAIDEASMLMTVLDRHALNTGLIAYEPTADKGYGNAENYTRLQERGTRPCIPHKMVREDPAMFPRSMFIYDPKSDTYCCPAGQTLTRRGKPVDERHRYQPKTGVCQNCPLKSQCTAGKQRIISRQLRQDAIDWADHVLSRGQRKSRMRKRKIRVEGSFADAANRHGYKRARWRGGAKVTIQNLLITATQNLRKLVRYGKPRPQSGAGQRPTCRRPFLSTVCALHRAPIAARGRISRAKHLRRRLSAKSPAHRR
jgi:transposase